MIGTPVRDSASTRRELVGQARRGRSTTTRASAPTGPSPAATASASRSATTGNSAQHLSARVGVSRRRQRGVARHDAQPGGAAGQQQPGERRAGWRAGPSRPIDEHGAERGQAPRRPARGGTRSTVIVVPARRVAAGRARDRREALESARPPLERSGSTERGQGRRRGGRTDASRLQVRARERHVADVGQDSALEARAPADRSTTARRGRAPSPTPAPSEHAGGERRSREHPALFGQPTEPHHQPVGDEAERRRRPRARPHRPASGSGRSPRAGSTGRAGRPTARRRRAGRR